MIRHFSGDLINDSIRGNITDFLHHQGLNMTIFDLNMQFISSFPHKKSPLCLQLEKNIETKAKCHLCDKNAIKNVQQSKTMYCYQCWCGLWEAIIPLYAYGKMTGYLMMGQVLMKDSNQEEIYTNLKPFLQKETSKQLISKTTVHTKKEIIAYAQLMIICANYITSNNVINNVPENLAEEVQQFLQFHFDENITIKKLCSFFHVSKSTLMNHYKKRYNKTIHQELLSIRLLEAEKLLKTTNHTMTEIASMCGYSDESYFSKAIKRKYKQKSLDIKNKKME